METFPVTIKKSWVGYILILLGYGLVFTLIWVGIFYTGSIGYLTDPIFNMLWITSAFVALIMVVSLYVYDLSYIEISEDGLQAENWTSLLSQVDVKAEWVRVQDVTIETGFLYLLFHCGTLVIQTAGTAQQLKMTMVPNVEYWAGIINAFADEATDVQQVEIVNPVP